MAHSWEADPLASLAHRLGKSPAELGTTGGENGCPDVWELDNGDFAVIGRDLTASYTSRLPDDVTLGPDERLVVIPRIMLTTAKKDIPDA